MWCWACTSRRAEAGRQRSGLQRLQLQRRLALLRHVAPLCTPCLQPAAGHSTSKTRGAARRACAE